MADVTQEIFELTDKDFFDTIDRAKDQYEEYIKLYALGVQKEEEPQLDLTKRDNNHPLGIVIK